MHVEEWVSRERWRGKGDSLLAFLIEAPLYNNPFLLPSLPLPPNDVQVAALRHFVHVLLAFYLFLSGFGHFTYFWTTGDFGIKRFMQVKVPMLLYN